MNIILLDCDLLIEEELCRKNGSQLFKKEFTEIVRRDSRAQMWEVCILLFEFHCWRNVCEKSLHDDCWWELEDKDELFVFLFASQSILYNAPSEYEHDRRTDWREINDWTKCLVNSQSLIRVQASAFTKLQFRCCDVLILVSFFCFFVFNFFDFFQNLNHSPLSPPFLYW